MRKFLLLLLVCPLFANDGWDEAPFDADLPPPFFPFSVSGQVIDVRRTKFRTPDVKGQTLRYAQADSAIAYTHPCSEVFGFIVGAGWVGTDVDMEDNPFFDETCFNYANFSLGAFSRGFPDWTWTATVGVFLDTATLSFTDYALYQGVLWGKFTRCPMLELDFGLILEVGLNKEKVWPILGFVYRPREGLRVHAIYPIHISVEYDWNSCLTLAGSMRFFRNRHRVGDDEPLPQAIFEYQTWGVEGDVIYNPFGWLSIKGFLGSTLDGDFKITNRVDKDSTHFKFDGSYYAGASAILSF